MLLRIEEVSVQRGGRAVLRNLSFALAAGEVVTVTGRNGAGKSTLLRTVAGLLPTAAGRVVVPAAGDEVRGSETMHYLGYEDALKPALTVRENLEFWAAMLKGASPLAVQGSRGAPNMVEAAPDRVATPGHPSNPPLDALGAFGIARLIDLPAAYLSAGQKRRVALARLLLAPRPIWLLDEPLIALDAGAQETLASVMARHLAGGGAILAASHAPLGVPSRNIDLETGA